MKKGALLALVASAVFGSVFSTRVVGQQGQPRRSSCPTALAKKRSRPTARRCHGLNMITNYWGDTRQGWETLFGSMVTLPADQKAAVSSYLATHFPVKPATEAKIIPGPVNVTFKEWSALTLGSRPHDPMAAADGSVWWSGQFASKLGRVDPRTNDVKEFSLPDKSGPHGLIEDRQGNVWYTGIQKHVVGKLDPKTGQVQEFPVQKVLAEARGPHTPTFDQKGNLWFTLQSGHVGRIVPSTGEMKISAAPSNKPGAPTYPYGIRVNSQGVPWYVDFRGNRIASVDPVTMVIKEITLPNADSRPRRIGITSDDAVWWTDYTRGMIGRYDPKTGRHQGMGVARREGLGTVRDRVRWQYRVVQRVERQAQHAGALRPADGEVPDLGHSVRRPRGSAHAGDRERQPRAGRERHQQDCDS